MSSGSGKFRVKDLEGPLELEAKVMLSHQLGNHEGMTIRYLHSLGWCKGQIAESGEDLMGTGYVYVLFAKNEEDARRAAAIYKACQR